MPKRKLIPAGTVFEKWTVLHEGSDYISEKELLDKWNKIQEFKNANIL